MWQIVLMTSLGAGAGPVPPVDPNKPPLVSPRRLIEMFQTNEAFAEERYVGRTIQVRGKVVRITRSKNADPAWYFLFLDTEGAGDGPGGRLDLLLAFPEKDRKALAALNPGDVVTVHGRCASRVVWSGNEQKG